MSAKPGTPGFLYLSKTSSYLEMPVNQYVSGTCALIDHLFVKGKLTLQILESSIGRT